MKKQLLAPNGKPSNLTPEQYKLVRSKEFISWFGDWENDTENSSKVVDENGEPLVVYHGTTAEFYEFDLTYFGKTDEGFYGKGFYFTPNLETAEVYASISEWDKINNTFNKNGKILPLFLNFRNPILIDLKKFKIKNENGTNDSKIIIPNSIFSANTEYLSFEPNQIKLADGTNTTFDSGNSDIRFDEGGEVNKGGIIKIDGNIFKVKLYLEEHSYDRETDKETPMWFFKVYKMNGNDVDGILTEDNNLEGYSIGSFDSRKKAKDFLLKYSEELNVILLDDNGIGIKFFNNNNPDIRFDDGGVINTGLLAQIWGWFGIKF